MNEQVPADDPRIAATQGTRANRKLLAKHADALLAALRPDESVEWALTTVEVFRPQVGALTATRLLLFPMFKIGAAPQILTGPLTTEDRHATLMGQAVTVRDSRGTSVDLTVTSEDHQQLRRAATTAPAGAHARQDSENWDAEPWPANATAGLRWHWNRPVLIWQDAEQLAADHMRHLNFEEVTVTPPGRDNGLDVISLTGAAQVKFHTTPTGGPDIQRLQGAAVPFAAKLFYATDYTAAATAAAEVAGVCLYRFTTHGEVLTANSAARTLVTAKAPPPPARRDVLGRLTRPSRQLRALRWADQIEVAAKRPISNRRRKGARQLEQRQQALALLANALEQLEDSENVLYKRARKDRTVTEAEKSLKMAANLLGCQLR